MLGLPLVVLPALDLHPWLRREWRLHDLDRLHHHLLAEGVPAEGIVRTARGEGRVTVELEYGVDDMPYELTDELCRATPQVGDTLPLRVHPRRPEIALLERSCIFNPAIRRQDLGHAALASLAGIAPYLLLWGGMWLWMWLRVRRALRAAGRNAPSGAALAP